MHETLLATNSKTDVYKSPSDYTVDIIYRNKTTHMQEVSQLHYDSNFPLALLIIREGQVNCSDLLGSLRHQRPTLSLLKCTNFSA